MTCIPKLSPHCTCFYVSTCCWPLRSEVIPIGFVILWFFVMTFGSLVRGSRQSAVGNSAIARHRAIARAIATLLMIVLYLAYASIHWLESLSWVDSHLIYFKKTIAVFDRFSGRLTQVYVCHVITWTLTPPPPKEHVHHIGWWYILWYCGEQSGRHP